MPDRRCDRCRTPLDADDVASGHALVYPRAAGRPLLCLCPDCTEHYRQTTDAIPVRPGSRPRPKRHVGCPRPANPLPENWQGGQSIRQALARLTATGEVGQ